jgi:glutathione reductase (NADPH)
MEFDFDLFVIGGGSGGVRAARLTSELGFKVGLCEEYRMGGTCVIRGCVPKKLLYYASDFSKSFETSSSFGWNVSDLTFNWEKLIKSKDIEISRLEKIYHNNLVKAGVKVFNTRGKVKTKHTVQLNSGETFSARNILIAVGGYPSIPNYDGSQYCISSNEVFDLKVLPERILIIGGGYIACEFASILNGLGTKVLQLYRGRSILRGFDSEVTNHVAQAMMARGIDLQFNKEVKKISKTEAGFLVTISDGTSVTVDLVLSATGRTPATKDLGLEKLGLTLGEVGEVLVNEYSQTAIPSIFAVGDVTNRANLTPVAIREGAAFVRTVFEGKPTEAIHSSIPTAIFTQPEIGTVGLTEDEAKTKGPVEVFVAKFRPMSNVLSGNSEQILMKILVNQESQKVLGVHIAGAGASEMIQLAGVAIQMGARKEDFDNTIAVHPTAAEELVTMKLPSRVS